MLKRFIIACLWFPLLVCADSFIEGKDYEVVKGTTATTEKASVMEFFSYGCPWCYRIESRFHEWSAQHSTVTFSRVPVVFNKDWNIYAKAFYAGELLKINPKITPLLFKSIQIDKKSMTSKESMIAFFVDQGIDKSTAESAFVNSTLIDLKIAEGNALMTRFHITAVPAFVVNSHYRTDLQMAQSEDRLFKILDYLLSKPVVTGP